MGVAVAVFVAVVVGMGVPVGKRVAVAAPVAVGVAVITGCAGKAKVSAARQLSPWQATIAANCVSKIDIMAGGALSAIFSI